MLLYLYYFAIFINLQIAFNLLNYDLTRPLLRFNYMDFFIHADEHK